MRNGTNCLSYQNDEEFVSILKKIANGDFAKEYICDMRKNVKNFYVESFSDKAFLHKINEFLESEAKEGHYYIHPMIYDARFQKGKRR